MLYVFDNNDANKSEPKRIHKFFIARLYMVENSLAWLATAYMQERESVCYHNLSISSLFALISGRRISKPQFENYTKLIPKEFLFEAENNK